ncbi:MAG: TRAP transporter TatT component family protein [bacterium]
MTLFPAGKAEAGDKAFQEAVHLIEKGEKKLALHSLNKAEKILLRECEGPSRHSLCEYYLARLYLAEYSYFSQVDRNRKKADRALDQAEKYGRQAVSRRPKDARVHVIMGRIHQIQLSQYPLSSLTKAIGARHPVVEEYERALKLDPKNGEAELGLGIYYLTIPQFLGGDGHRAREHFKRAAKLMPQNPEPLVWVAISYRQEERLEDARKYLDKAEKIAPQDPFVQTEKTRLKRARK